MHSHINHGKGVIPAPIFIGINSSRNPDVVPAKAGNQYFSHWIPPYQVRGRLNQVRNDKLDKTYEVTYKRRTGQEVGSIR
jgi:hypothetical protein